MDSYEKNYQKERYLDCTNSRVFLKSGGQEKLVSTILFKKSATRVEKGKWMEWW